MEEAPWTPDRVRAALQAARAEDATFTDGTILGSMCTAPHPLGAEAYELFLETNLGDPAHFPGTARLEQELLADIAAMVGGTPAGTRYLTGGTEANLLACYIARERTGRDRIIVPESAHFSFDKAANLLQMDLVRIPTIDHRADVAAMRDAMQDAALVVGIAGTTELGLVDPIDSLARAAMDAGVPMHVDAAFGGYVLPFMQDAPPFDLSVPGVTSIGLDPHKMGMAPIPGGALVMADPADWQRIAVETGYVSTDSQSTIMGTRPGAATAAAWATHRALGRRGYEEIVARCLRESKRLATAITAAGGDIVAGPELNVVTFRVPDTQQTYERLIAAGFRTNRVPRLDALRIVVNPHVTPITVDRFIEAFPSTL